MSHFKMTTVSMGLTVSEIGCFGTTKGVCGGSLHTLSAHTHILEAWFKYAAHTHIGPISYSNTQTFWLYQFNSYSNAIQSIPIGANDTAYVPRMRYYPFTRKCLFFNQNQEYRIGLIVSWFHAIHASRWNWIFWICFFLCGVVDGEL